MNYGIFILKAAEKEMDGFPAQISQQISSKILSLEHNPRPAGTKKLIHREEYRIRSGDYRILYTIDDYKKIVTIVSVGHRREIYR